eukprot:273663_1
MPIYATRLNAIKSFGYRLDHAICKRRLLAGLAIPTFQAVAADLVAQLCMNKKSTNYSNEHYGFNTPSNTNSLYNSLHSINWNRNMVFAAFGFCYLGACQYLLYVKLLNKTFERFINPQNVILDRTVKVIFDQCIHTPFMYFPAFYFIKDSMQQGTNNKSLYRLPSMDDLCAAWKIWVPAQCITFTLGRHWRLPWIASVSFIWTVILSTRSMD